MTCPYFQQCGGCTLRNLSLDEYKQYKIERFSRFLTALHQPNISLKNPIFVSDSGRRRVEFAFHFAKNQLTFGFHKAKTHNIISIDHCLSLTPEINSIIAPLKDFLVQLCSIKTNKKIKNKFCQCQITQGKIFVTKAANGLDVVLDINEKISLEHRMLICEFAQNTNSIIRISTGQKNCSPETIVEKIKPFIENSGYRIYISAGTFLQATDESQAALIKLVTEYSGELPQKVADLFCGIGTFSYPLAKNIKNKITAVDSSAELLDGFTQTVNALSLPNITIKKQNLFKYPLTADELKEFDLIVFDPPRAGAAAQIKEIISQEKSDKPQKIIAISCNPHTFINDANALISGGYKITEITMVDQFLYTDHFELVALFEKGENNES